jgi:hypothetical protein
LMHQNNYQPNTHYCSDVYRSAQNLIEEPLAKSILSKISIEDVSPGMLEVLLKDLFVDANDEAKILALSLVSLPLPILGEVRDRAVVSASMLLSHIDDSIWPSIWVVIEQDFNFGREVFKFIGRRIIYDGPTRGSFQALKEEYLADLFVFLARHYPETEKENASLPDNSNKLVGVPWRVQDLDEDDAIEKLKRYILQWIEDRGTSEACEALRKIICEFPELADGLRWYLLEAEATVRLNTWNPPEPEHIFQLVLNQDKRLVQDEHQLLKVLLESLDRLELELQGETSAVRDLWDKCNDNFFRPIDENAFSDYVKRFLDRDLKSRGIIVNREVELRRGSGGKSGERTDIHIDAVLKHPSGQTYSSITVIVEVKGCWHSEVQTAMESQLVGRYLSDNACRHGLYLIGWFSCQQWDSQDSRKNKTPRMTLDEARIQFDSQAETLSSSETEVCSYVLNTALR